jgi:branched-subunit amino acid aminotransferase/4-amino-4-deoxychorismate lyase
MESALTDSDSFATTIAFDSDGWKRKHELRWRHNDVATLQGILVVERMRTFGGRLFAVNEHLNRLTESLQLLGLTGDVHADSVANPNPVVSRDAGCTLSISRSGIDPMLPLESQICELIRQLIDKNQSLLNDVTANAQDGSLVVAVSPGLATSPPRLSAPQAAFPDLEGVLPVADRQLSAMLYLDPIHFRQLHRQYTEGTHLWIAPNANVPADCWSPQIKTRSRISYYLADDYAKSKDPHGLGLLRSTGGYITDTSIANIALVRNQREIVLVPRHLALDGITQQTTEHLATGLGFRVTREDISLKDLESADQVFLMGTTGCVWPATKINGLSIEHSDWQGSVGQQLQEAWKSLLKFDFMSQAKEWAK